ncbi:MAG TPA: response regulator [Verrucomicrobiae bacterium]|nr:response regulator [Verrucomicrobiae bacterium]
MKLFGSWRKEPAPATAEESAFTPDDQPSMSGKLGAMPIGQGRKILVVDDNVVVLKAFELKMQSLGFTVFTATDGATAVSCARQEKPDVIVLDINFPPDVGNSGLQWDGFNIMEWMKRFQEAANIPVVIITSGDAEKLKAKAMSCGAVAFFQKPINNEEFILTLRRLIGQSSKKPAAL